MTTESSSRGPLAARWRFGLLLVALSLFLLTVMVFDPSRNDDRIFSLVLIPVLLATGYAISQELRSAVAWVGVGLLLGVINWDASASTSSSTFALRHGLQALFWMVTAFAVLRTVLTQPRVDADTILGGICVFLLVIVIFTMLHAIVNVLLPGAYLYQGAPIDLQSNHFWSLFLYFSVVTTTTLGFGDFVPVVGPGYMLTSVQAILGQLFIAILIGRLVGLRTRGVATS